MNYREIETLLKKLPHRIQIEFALYCAKDVFHLIPEKDKAYAQNCIETIEGFLKGEKSEEDCWNLTNTTEHAPGYQIDNTVYTTFTIEAAIDTVIADADNTADPAISSYAYATKAAYYATKAKNVDAKEYYDVLLTWVNELGTIEKLIYGIE